MIRIYNQNSRLSTREVEILIRESGAMVYRDACNDIAEITATSWDLVDSLAHSFYDLRRVASRSLLVFAKSTGYG